MWVFRDNCEEIQKIQVAPSFPNTTKQESSALPKIIPTSEMEWSMEDMNWHLVPGASIFMVVCKTSQWSMYQIFLSLLVFLWNLLWNLLYRGYICQNLAESGLFLIQRLLYLGKSFSSDKTNECQLKLPLCLFSSSPSSSSSVWEWVEHFFIWFDWPKDPMLCKNRHTLLILDTLKHLLTIPPGPTWCWLGRHLCSCCYKSRWISVRDAVITADTAKSCKTRKKKAHK